MQQFRGNFEDNIEDNSGRINTHLTPFTAMCFVQITLGAYICLMQMTRYFASTES